MSGPHTHMLSWSLPLAIISALVAVTALVYLRGWLCLRNAFPNLIPGWRLAAFMGGLVFVWTVVGSPLDTLDHQSLTIHMMKHLLLMTVAAPLILVGAPLFPLVCGLPKLFIKTHSALASPPTRWPERCLTHPALCWLAGTAAVIGWHLPVAFQLGMRSHWVHDLEDLSFLVAGLLFWWPIVQALPRAASSPRWYMALYLFLATLPCDILSAFLVFSNRLVYTCLSLLSLQTSTVQYGPASGPRMCRRPDVGLGNVRVPDSSRRYHSADSLAVEFAIARIHAGRAAKSSGGSLNGAEAL